MRSLLPILLLLLTALPAPAQEDAVPLPRERPAAGAENPPLPRSRPEPRSPETATPAGDVDAETAEGGPAEPREGEADPAPGEETAPRVYQAACPAMLRGDVAASILPPLADEICRARSPYAVTGFNAGGKQVTLSAPVALNCQMASALVEWVRNVDIYMRTMFDSGLARILSGTSYMCRPRNNAEGADVSEHGFANALDIRGFELEDGRRMGLPQHWSGDAPEARAMRYAHDAACGHFTTVLGPDANALHEDHLHLDLGCHGRTCTARICD